MKLLFILLVSVTYNILGQGSFLDIGESGFRFSGIYSANKDYSGYAAGGGYSFNGSIDVGIEVGSFVAETKLLGFDLKAKVISPTVNYFIIKQCEKRPFSISLGISYEKTTYSSDALDYFGWEIYGNYFSYGGALYTKLLISETTAMQPYIKVFYTSGEAIIKDSYGETISETNNEINFGLGGSLIFDLSAKLILGITPGININRDTRTYVIIGSIVIKN